MKKLKLLAFVFAGIAFGVVSCSKSATGPAGPAGATGPAGPAGPAGSSGTDSILHSPWISLSMTLETDASNDTAYFQIINASAITQNIIDNGLVLSYIQNLFVNDGSIVDVSDYSSFLDVSYNVGVINITSFIGDLSQSSFRYVIIPGSILTGTSFKQYTKEQIKAMDYSTIQKLLSTVSVKSTTN